MWKDQHNLQWQRNEIKNEIMDNIQSFNKSLFSVQEAGIKILDMLA